MFGAIVPYRTRGIWVTKSHVMLLQGASLFFGLSVAGGWLTGRILRQGHLLEIPENVQSLVEQSQMQKQLIIIKEDNVILTKTSLISKVIFSFVRQCGNCGIDIYK